MYIWIFCFCYQLQQNDFMFIIFFREKLETQELLGYLEKMVTW